MIVESLVGLFQLVHLNGGISAFIGRAGLFVSDSVDFFPDFTAQPPHQRHEPENNGHRNAHGLPSTHACGKLFRQEGRAESLQSCIDVFRFSKDTDVPKLSTGERPARIDA